MRIQFGKPKPPGGASPRAHPSPPRKSQKIKGADNTLEQSFLDNFKGGQIALVCGVKKSGKSVMTLCYLKNCFDRNEYQEYYICAPNYNLEAKGSYDFIKAYKGSSKVYVFTQWDELVLQRIMKSDRNKTKLLISDDMTSYMNLASSHIENRFMASIRHYNCSAILIFHILKAKSGGLSAPFRSNVDHLFIYLNVNRKSLEDLYTEFLSMTFKDFNSFLAYYKEKILSTQYNALYVNTRAVDTYDPRVIDWNILKLKDEIIGKS